jgi:hypothetical protein
MSLFGYPGHHVAENLSATFYPFHGLSMIRMHALHSHLQQLHCIETGLSIIFHVDRRGVIYSAKTSFLGVLSGVRS